MFSISFITQFFQMKDQYFSAKFEALMKLFQVEVILTFMRGSYLVFFSFNDTKNRSILNTAINYILSTERFDVSLANF